MKIIRNSFVWFVASVALAGSAPAQDKSTLLHQMPATNSVAGTAVKLSTRPKVVLRSGTQVTGLFVDLIRPQQMRAMLNPSGPARDLPKPTPPYLLPVTAPRQFNSNLAVHDDDFALLRFSFQ